LTSDRCLGNDARVTRRRASRIIACAITAALGAAACVDLFHSTDYTTLCEANPAACAPEASLPEASLTDVVAPDGSTTDFCAWSRDEAQAHAERACAWLGACHGVLEESTFAKCMVRALGAYDCTFNPSLRPKGETHALWSCLANVASCDAVSSCVFGVVPQCGAVTGTFTTCTTPGGPTRLACGPGDKDPIAVESCLLEGRSCAKVDSPTQGFCTGKRGLACTGSGTCDGTHAVVCDAGPSSDPIDVGLDCAAFGAGRCVADDAGIACAPDDTGGPCDGGSKLRCDDAGVAHRCVEGKDITIDCPRIAQQCLATGDAVTALEPTRACINRDASASCSGPDQCVGDVLKSCAQGKRFELSCSKIGLGSCTVPDSGERFARCTKP
jgi:hypothetical protein